MMRDDSVKKVLNYIICAYILSYALPSGMLAGFPVQKILVVVIVMCALVVFIQQGHVLEIIRKSPFEIAVAAAGLIWCAVGWYRGMTWSITVFTLLYIGAVILLVFRYLLDYGFLNVDMVVRCVLFMMIIKIALKLLIEAAFVAGVLDYDGVSEFYFQVFSTEATMMTMDFGSLELVRIQESSDAIVFTLIPFYWFMPERRKGEPVALFLVMTVYVMLVFSRVYLVEFACFAFLAAVYYWKRIPRNQRFAGIGVLAVLVIVLARPVIGMLKFRFFSSFTVESDTTRVVQMKELWQGILEQPWLGHGMGSYLPDYIRSELFPFSYEMEYLSFIYQLGMIGFVLIIGGIVCIFLKQIYPHLKRNPHIVRAVSVLGVSWFLFRPLLNPAFLGKQNQFLLIGIFLINAWYSSGREDEKQRIELPKYPKEKECVCRCVK